MTLRSFVAAVAGLLCAVNGVPSSRAADSGGSEMHERGIDLSVAYLSETATNVRGGREQLWRYADQWTLAAAFDLHRLADLEHASLQITITDRNGRNLSSDAGLNTLLEVQEIYGRGQTWRWTQLEYRQTFFDERLDWKIGRLAGGEDFADFSCEFLNLTFCGQAPGNIAGAYWYTWPVSQWATRLKIAVGPSAYVQLGVFEANSRYLQTRNGLNLGEPGAAEGMLVPLEIGWQPRWDDGASGSYKLGVWYNTSNAADVADDTRMRRGHAGAYFDLLQTFGNVSAFVNGAFGDRGTSRIDNQLTAGVLRTGLFAARPLDTVGFAIGRTHVNSRARVPSQGLPSAEYLTEAYYNVHLPVGLDLRPSIQFVHWKNAPSGDADTLVFGMRLSFAL